MAQTPVPGHVLVVDDNETNRHMLCRVLERQSYTTGTARDGREALAKLHEEHFDLVLLDILMPVMDGFEVLSSLKVDPVLRETPVLVLSAIQEMDAVIRCIKMGADDYLPKPIDLTLLRARVGASIEKKRLHERERQLLLNILPPRIAQELRERGSVEPRYLDEVTILFTDFVKFSRLTRLLSARELVDLLDRCFTEFDHIVARHGLEKLKTIGDSYMLVGGLEGQPSHAVDAVSAAFAMLDAVSRVSVSDQSPLSVRIGVHSGPVVAGVVGVHKFAFDVWGDSVNYAARLESHGEPGRINISSRTCSLVSKFFECSHRGQIKTKDGRHEDMYFVNGPIRAGFRDRYIQQFGRDAEFSLAEPAA